MNGSKMTVMTSKQMRKMREQGKSKTNWARVLRDYTQGVPPSQDRDSPDASRRMRTVIAKRRAGRPAGTGKKEQVAIRFDHDVLSRFRAGGPGWQTRMNNALREWLRDRT